MTKQYEVRDADDRLVEFGDTLRYPPYDYVEGHFSHVSAWPADGGGKVVISGMEFYASTWNLSIKPVQPESD